MGLAILPARLKKEMELLKDYILNKKDIRSNADIEKHADWVVSSFRINTDINEENIDVS